MLFKNVLLNVLYKETIKDDIYLHAKNNNSA